MGYDILAERIKEHEGFRNTVYRDSLGKATIGYGHLLTRYDNFEEGVEYSEWDLDFLFHSDLHKAIVGAFALIEANTWGVLPPEVREVLIEMVFQLGKASVGRFQKMWTALGETPPNFHEAAAQMIDSRWHTQTPGRCERLAEIVRNAARS